MIECRRKKGVLHKKTNNQASELPELPLGAKIKKDWYKNKTLYCLFLPVLIWYLVFQYGSMIGLTIAFQNYKPSLGFFDSPWVGLKNFKFANTTYFAPMMAGATISALPMFILFFSLQKYFLEGVTIGAVKG